MKLIEKIRNYAHIAASAYRMQKSQCRDRLVEMTTEITAFSNPHAHRLKWKDGRYETVYQGIPVVYWGNPCYLMETFFDGEYADLDCRGKTIVDIGMAYGDTMLLFHLRGAKRIIGYEIDKHRAITAELNARENGVENVQIHAIGAESLPIPTEQGWIAKLDCEGAEYEIIRGAKKELPGYDQIMIEYHYGPQDVPELLEASGFDVTIHPKKGSTMGLIYAKRRD